MKRIRYIVQLLVALCIGLIGNNMQAQLIDLKTLNSTTNGTNITVNTIGCRLSSQAQTGYANLYVETVSLGGGKYDTIDWWVTLTSSACSDPERFGLVFDVFDIDESDTLFVYDGPSVNSPLLAKSNNNFNSLAYQKLVCSQLNTTGSLTVRFKTSGDHDGDTSGTKKGFLITAGCTIPCETSTPVIEDVFYKLADGVVIDSMRLKPVTEYDTTFYKDTSTGDFTDSIISIDPKYYIDALICQGECVMFKGHGVYTNNLGFYRPSDETTDFLWDFGNGDTLAGLTEKVGVACYKALDCYAVRLQLTDEQGCVSKTQATVRVRISQNPIKTIYDLATMCNSDSLVVNVGYEGENPTITMRRIERPKANHKTTYCKTFLPDGASCGNSGCFTAPITFDEFPAGRSVLNKDEICSICINYEHSYMGDYELSIVCPTGGSAVLKTRAHGGGSIYTGIPYGGANDGTWDRKPTADGTNCDSASNMYGVGFDYCFSLNPDYTLVDGQKANTTLDGDYWIYNRTNMITITDYKFQTVPPPYKDAGKTAANSTFQTKKPSNPDEKTDYYKPDDDFSGLVGCPLNGTWEIKLCDFLGQDNGWIFSWSLDICGVKQGMDCNYQVGIDSVVWLPDSTYGDWDLGHFRGLDIVYLDSVRTLIKSPDTAGYFPINVSIFDEFGCRWDTNTAIKTVWTPKPNLGTNLLLCSTDTVVLDARDRFSYYPETDYHYIWDPSGKTTDTIYTQVNYDIDSMKYTVEVTNYQYDIRCRTRDSIRVVMSQQPQPNIDFDRYPLEGCEPFTIQFKNVSQGGDKFKWYFGDGDSSVAESPVHSFGKGSYNLKFYAESNSGCKDSIIADNLITVFPSPRARFSWEPTNPTVLNPKVHLVNRTEPQTDANRYYWEIQYDRNNPHSYHTMTDKDADFEWTTDGEDISASYIARLIAKTEQYGPSGNLVECRDTMENRILLVNDFLQFPTVITANGDGINDKFEIVNLINGFGYPNNSLAIYDKWGKRVYYKENITSEDDFWDPGKENAPTGSYFWRFSGKGYLGDIQRNGVVEVLR